MLATFQRRGGEEPGEPFLGALIWYSDPSCIEKEMRPPVLNACKSIEPKSNHYMKPAFTLLRYENKLYSVDHGRLERDSRESAEENSNTSIFWTESQEYRVTFGLHSDENDRINSLASLKGKVKMNTQIPVLMESECVFVEKKRVTSADKLWAAGLLLSRAVVTRLTVLYALEPFEIASDHYARERRPKAAMTNLLYAWWPAPKPANLKTWFSYLSGKKVSSFSGSWENECTPFVEGFYRLALKNAATGDTQYETTCDIVLHEAHSRNQSCFADTPSEPTKQEREAGFVEEQDRVRLATVLPIALCNPNRDAEVTGEWGWGGYTARSYLFVLPGSTEERMFSDPFRSPANGSYFKKKHGSASNQLEAEQKGVFTGVCKDAALNQEDYLSRTGLEKMCSQRMKTLHEGSLREEEVVPREKVGKRDGEKNKMIKPAAEKEEEREKDASPEGAKGETKGRPKKPATEIEEENEKEASPKIKKGTRAGTEIEREPVKGREEGSSEVPKGTEIDGRAATASVEAVIGEPPKMTTGHMEALTAPAKGVEAVEKKKKKDPQHDSEEKDPERKPEEKKEKKQAVESSPTAEKRGNKDSDGGDKSDDECQGVAVTASTTDVAKLDSTKRKKRNARPKYFSRSKRPKTKR